MLPDHKAPTQHANAIAAYRPGVLFPTMRFCGCGLERATHHLHHLHLGVQPQVVQEHLQVLLHLDGVVVHLGHGEDAHLALPPHLSGETHGGGAPFNKVDAGGGGGGGGMIEDNGQMRLSIVERQTKRTLSVFMNR